MQNYLQTLLLCSSLETSLSIICVIPEVFPENFSEKSSEVSPVKVIQVHAMYLPYGASRSGLRLLMAFTQTDHGM